MGCRPGISSSPVPFLARYLEYRLSRRSGTLPASRDATIETRLKWILDELLGPSSLPTATVAGAEEQQQQKRYYEALLTLCHHINDYSLEMQKRWWGGNPGWYRGITQKLDRLTPVVPGRSPAMERQCIEQTEQDGRASLLPAAIALGLEAIYGPNIAAAVPYSTRDINSFTTHVGSYKVNLRGRSSSFGTPLYAAVKAQKPGLVRRILSSGIGISDDSCNPVAAAVQNDDMDILNQLLELQYRVAPHQPHVLTAIEIAASLGKTAFIQKILDFHGLNSSRMADRDWRMGRALLRAVYGNHVEVARLLIDNDAPFPTMDRPDGEAGAGSTRPALVEIAAWQGHLEMLRLLLRNNALVTIDSARAAVAGNRVDALRFLLETNILRLDKFEWCNVLSDGANLDSTAAILYLIGEAQVLDIPGILHSSDLEAVYLSEVAGTLCSRGNHLAVEAMIRAGLPVDHNCSLDPDDDVDGDNSNLSVQMKLMDLAANSSAPGAAETVDMLTRYGASPAPKRKKQYVPCEWKSLMPLNRGIREVTPQNTYHTRGIVLQSNGLYVYAEDLEPLPPGGSQRVPVVREPRHFLVASQK